MRRWRKPVRVVLDTNVLISALISSSGPPGQLLSAVKRGDMTLVTSEYQLEELRNVLGRDKLRPYIRPEEAQDLINNLETIGSLISDLPECGLSPDPADNPILATAIAGKADLIVSGDKADMLALGYVDDIQSYLQHRLGKLGERLAGTGSARRRFLSAWAFGNASSTQASAQSEMGSKSSQEDGQRAWVRNRLSCRSLRVA